VKAKSANLKIIFLLIECSFLAVEVLLDRYSLMPYHHATRKVGRLPPVKCPPSHNLPPVKLPLPVTCPFVKAHTKLPILAAYLYLVAGYRNGDR